MDQDVWNLHAAVFDLAVALAPALGLGAFRVDSKSHPAGVLIELVIEKPFDATIPGGPPAAQTVVAATRSLEQGVVTERGTVSASRESIAHRR
jgi:hypothetical protein